MVRIPLVDRTALDAGGQRVWDDIAGDRGDVPVSYRSLLNSPGLAKAVAALGGFLRFESSVPPRVREVAVLTVNHELGCRVGWVHHAVIAAQMGVGAADIDAIGAGTEPAGLTADEQLGRRLAVETIRSGSARAETLATAVGTFGAERTTDLVVAIGYYTMIAQYLLTLDIEVEPDGLQHLSQGRDVLAALSDRPQPS